MNPILRLIIGILIDAKCICKEIEPGQHFQKCRVCDKIDEAIELATKSLQY